MEDDGISVVCNVAYGNLEFVSGKKPAWHAVKVIGRLFCLCCHYIILIVFED